MLPRVCACYSGAGGPPSFSQRSSARFLSVAADFLFGLADFLPGFSDLSASVIRPIVRTIPDYLTYFRTKKPGQRHLSAIARNMR